jgi:tetratricopeptide (TPR) repeat protein
MKVRLTFFAFLFISTILFITLPGCQDYKRKAIELKHEGIDLVYRTQFDQAIDVLQKSVKYNSNDPETYFFIGNAYYGKHLVDSAFSYYSKAIEVDPRFGQAYVNRGRIYKERNDRDNACRDWLKAEECGIMSMKEETKFCK